MISSRAIASMVLGMALGTSAAAHAADGDSAAGRQNIVKALHDYKAGTRKHPSMNSIAASLSDKDMADLAAYYGSDAK